MLYQVRDLPSKSISKEWETFVIYYLSCAFVNLDAHLYPDWGTKIDKDRTITINGCKTSDLWTGTIHADTTPLRMKICNVCGDETIITLEEQK